MGDPSEADVYVDVLFDDGLVFLVVCNVGAVAAQRVRVTFDRPLIGADGRDITTLGIFSNLDYLAAGKRVSVFVDRAAAYYASRQRSRLTCTIAWRAGGKSLGSTITHDFRAYADLPYTVNQPDRRRVGHPLR